MPPLNVADMSDAERGRRGIEALPGTLIEAVGEMEKDDFVKTVLGRHISEKYIAAKCQRQVGIGGRVGTAKLNPHILPTGGRNPDKRAAVFCAPRLRQRRRNGTNTALR